MEGGVWRQWTDLWRVGYGGNGLTYGGWGMEATFPSMRYNSSDEVAMCGVSTSKRGSWCRYKSGGGTRCAVMGECAQDG